MSIHFDKASVYTDLQGLAGLRMAAREDSPEALREVASQFEAMFLQQMLKSMRQASFGDALFDSEQSDFYRDMHDSQLAISLAKARGIGLADALVRQLGGDDRAPALPPVEGGRQGFAVPERNLGLRAVMPPVPAADAPSQAAAVAVAKAAPPAVPTEIDVSSPEAFVRSMWPLAEPAARQLGVAPEVLIAQAALETGWGRKVIRHADGSSSHNLFNIKADRRWDGERVAVSTLEYVGGVAQQERAAFRAYSSYQESFQDYVDFLRTSPRYADALRRADDPGAFIDALHRAGYATDPHYAEKVRRIMAGDLMAQGTADLKIST